MSALKLCVFYTEKNWMVHNVVFFIFIRLAAAAEGKGPKVIARQEESSEEEEEEEELTPEERGRPKSDGFFLGRFFNYYLYFLVSLFLLDFFFTHAVSAIQ